MLNGVSNQYNRFLRTYVEDKDISVDIIKIFYI